MSKNVLYFFLIFLILPELKAAPSFSSNYFTLYNNDNDYSYGLCEIFNLDLEKGNFSFYNDNVLGKYKNLYIPFENFSIYSPDLNFYSYYLTSQFSFDKLKAGIKFFSPLLLNNSFSVSFLDFQVQLEKPFGGGFFINLYDDFSLSFNYFSCDAEMVQYKADGNLKAFFAGSDYSLHNSRFDIKFMLSYLYATASYAFDFSSIAIPMLNYTFQGKGNIDLSALGTGTSIKTHNNNINFLLNLDFIYLFSAKINTEVYKNTRFLFFDASSKNFYRKDYSKTLLIPLSLAFIIDADFSAVHIESSLSKSLVIPLSFNKSFNIFESTSKTTEKDKAYSLLRILLLSGININLTVSF